jgi:hypothetical protein
MMTRLIMVTADFLVNADCIIFLVLNLEDHVVSSFLLYGRRYSIYKLEST